MKKRIQKYLSGSNEGFSLVELIIVIAIMAILVGVVALAVIPYLEKSRESKDLQALDTIASAATTAVADAKVTGSGTVTFSAGAWPSGATGDAKKIVDSMKTTLGEANLEFGSGNAKGGDVKVVYDSSKNLVYAYVTAPSGKTSCSVDVGSGTNKATVTVAQCQYNDEAPFCISNAKVTKSSTQAPTQNPTPGNNG